MKSVSVDPGDIDSVDVEMSDDLRAAVDREMEYLGDRAVKQLRMRCRRGSDEVYQATIHADDEMYRLSEVSPGNVSRTVFRDPERKGDENLVGAPSELDDEEAEEAEEQEGSDGEPSDGTPEVEKGGDGDGDDEEGGEDVGGQEEGEEAGEPEDDGSGSADDEEVSGEEAEEGTDEEADG